ncbi:MAG: hypothetical protein LBN97_01950 [Oscillospiraceae bacterium]|nr:hypothetical protein [Oscillospiraceae bacterium]
MLRQLKQLSKTHKFLFGTSFICIVLDIALTVIWYAKKEYLTGSLWLLAGLIYCAALIIRFRHIKPSDSHSQEN